MIGGQRIQVGLAHARKTAGVTVEAGTCQITVEPGITITAPRTTNSDIRRRKAPEAGLDGVRGQRPALAGAEQGDVRAGAAFGQPVA